MHLINVWIVLAILLGLLAVTRLLRYDDVSHYEVFSDREWIGRIAERERVAAMPEQHIGEARLISPRARLIGAAGMMSLADERAA